MINADKKEKIRLYTVSVIDLAVFALVLYSVLDFMFNGGEGNMEGISTECFMYFTIDSNILAAIACALTVPFRIICSTKGKELPAALTVFRLAGTAAVAVTLFTVLFFLGPTVGYAPMFEGANLFLHLICPVICIITYIFFDKSGKTGLVNFVYGVLPALIYGIVYSLNVLTFKVWKDFYGFTAGGKWYISALAMALGTALISILLILARNMAAGNNSKNK